MGSRARKIYLELHIIPLKVNDLSNEVYFSLIYNQIYTFFSLKYQKNNINYNIYDIVVISET